MKDKILSTSSQSQKTIEIERRVEPKPYEKPALTKYGGISSIVQALGGNGTDGSGFPPVSLT